MQIDQADDHQPNGLDGAGAMARLRQDIGEWSHWKSGRKKTPVLLRKLINKNTLFWGLSTNQTIHQPLIARLVSLKSKAPKNEDFDFSEAVAQWLAEANDSLHSDPDSSLSVCLEALAWAHALNSLTSRLHAENQDSEEQDSEEQDGAAWLELTAFLLSLTSTQAETDALGPQSYSLKDFLLTVELPLTLSFVLPDLAVCKPLRKVARDRFSLLADALLDGEGMPHARHLSDMQLLVASCTRCLVIDDASKKLRIGKSARLQFDWLTRQVLRFARPTGACMLGRQLDSPHFDDLIKHATKIAQDDTDVAAFKKLRGKRLAEDVECPEPSEHSEWSEVAVMRSAWSPNSVSLAVDYGQRSLRTELGVGNEAIFSGDHQPRVTVDGEALAAVSDFEEICWEHDEDVDYLELEMKFEKDWVLQRQYLLARRDQFVFVADAIMGPGTAKVQYQQSWPLCDGITADQNDENTELVLLGRKKIGPVLPLALSEWRSGLGKERLRQEPARLEVSSNTSALYVPLFFGLDPTARNQPYTWRTLTVAENLLAVPKDVAVAYRVQIGKSQWVIYRSLQKPGNRTFLGLNVVSDFYVGRLQADGEAEMMIDVEPNE